MNEGNIQEIYLGYFFFILTSAKSCSWIKNWIPSTHLSASAAHIKASEDTADLVPTAAALKKRDDITFLDIVILLFCLLFFEDFCYLGFFLEILHYFDLRK